MTKLMPNMRNRRTGEDDLARWLDRFLIKAPLLTRLDRFHEWVGFDGLSDHSLIFLEIWDENLKPQSYFNFKSTWLSKVEFHKIVRDSWTHYRPNDHSSPAKVIANNLECIK